MDKITYKRNLEGDKDLKSREADTVEMSTPSDMTIDEFYVISMRLALALGYSPETVRAKFGRLPDIDKKELLCD